MGKIGKTEACGETVHEFIYPLVVSLGKTIDYGLASFYTHAGTHDADLLGFR